MIMADKTEISGSNMGKIAVHPVESCNLGKLGDGAIALRINVAADAGASRAGQSHHAVFGLSHEMASGLVKALTAILEEPASTAKH